MQFISCQWVYKENRHTHIVTTGRKKANRFFSYLSILLKKKKEGNYLEN